MWQKLIKIGANESRLHAVFQLAEIAVLRQVFEDMLRQVFEDILRVLAELRPFSRHWEPHTQAAEICAP